MRLPTAVSYRPFGEEKVAVEMDDLDGTYQNALDKLLRLEKGPVPSDWEKAVDITSPCPGRVHCRIGDGESRAGTWVSDIPATPAVLLHLMCAIRMQWDFNFTQFYVPEQIGSGSAPVDLLYCRCKAPVAFLADRDYCQLRLVRPLPDGGVAIILTSITHPSLPEVPDCVRTHTLLAGYIIRPSKTMAGASDLFFASHASIGNVPTWGMAGIAGKVFERWVGTLINAATSIGSPSASQSTWDSVMRNQGIPMIRADDSSNDSFCTMQSFPESDELEGAVMVGSCNYYSCGSNTQCNIM